MECMCVTFPGTRRVHPRRTPATATGRHRLALLPTHFFELLFNTTRNRPGSMSTGIASVRRQACAQGATLSNLTRLDLT
jgi:hypothetical protein